MNLQKLRALADAVSLKDEDWGTGPQIDAENAWGAALEEWLDKWAFEDFEVYALKATTAEMIEYGMDLAERVPLALKRHVTEARDDVTLYWDEAVYERATDEWVVPCEAHFTPEDGVDLIGLAHGNMRCEFDPDADLVDYFVGDWEAGPHPDITDGGRA